MKLRIYENFADAPHFCRMFVRAKMTNFGRFVSFRARGIDHFNVDVILNLFTNVTKSNVSCDERRNR